MSEPGASRRVDALRHYQILDSDYEEKFQSLVKLAAIICATPISLISLLDERRQWFKAVFGLEVAETSLDHSFCLHAVESGEDVYAIECASRHEVFGENPYVTGSPHIEFYAAAPLVTPDGVAIGTLCVIDSVPHELTNDQRAALGILARQVMLLFEYRKSSLELHERLGELKVLEGFWKVCMYCRRIESDHGKWVQFEAHVRAKTHAEFSHGVCPDCVAAVILPEGPQ